MLTFLDELNRNQLMVVTAPDGHLLINAAAGTGKTTTLAARILYLQLEKGIDPSSMLAISFSRSARKGLTDKLESFRQEIGSGSPIETLTFHGLAFRILRIAANLGETWLKPGFKIIENHIDIFNQHENSFFIDVELKHDMPRLYAKAIDSLRQGHPELGRVYLSSTELSEDIRIKIETEHSVKVPVKSSDIKRVWKRYQTYLKRTNQIDYPGLISEAVKVLQHKAGATRKRLQLGLKYLFIDEYQDSSKAQETLAFLLAGDKLFLNVVGDNEQTIYTFNGSNVSNILQFNERAKEKGLPVLETIDLIENYRSSSNILSVANRIVEKGNSLYKKELVPAIHVSGDVKGYQLTNNKVKLIRVPRIGQAADFVAKEIKEIVKQGEIRYSEIAVLVRKDSEFSPQGFEVKKALEQCAIPVGISMTKQQDTKKIYEAVEEICQYYYNETIVDVLTSLEQGEYVNEHVDSIEILHILQEAQDSGALYAYDVLDFVIDSISADDALNDVDGVQIRTVHSAKGLEFRVVFVLFLGDKSFPHGSKPDIEEERRLFYVAITRAQDRLYLLGRNGIHGPDFLGESLGVETTLIDYFANKNEQTEKNEKLIIEINEVKDAIKKEEEEQRKNLMALFEDDDF